MCTGVWCQRDDGRTEFLWWSIPVGVQVIDEEVDAVFEGKKKKKKKTKEVRGSWHDVGGLCPACSSMGEQGWGLGCTHVAGG